MNRKKLWKFTLLIVIFLSIFSQLDLVHLNTQKENFTSEKNRTIENKVDESPDTADTISDGSFSDQGNPQNVSLQYIKEKSFKNNKTSDGKITIENSVPGWNMTNFKLNFTGLSTTSKYVSFETRVDGSDEFSADNSWYAASFYIPNTCYLKNISMFIQYFGGEVGGAPKQSKFSIRIYNATLNAGNLIPNKTLDGAADQYSYDLTNLEYGQPVKWYQSNFTNIQLDISKTINNTFFAVFNAINVPNKALLTKTGFIFYANDQPDDQYDSVFLKTSGWTKQTGKKALLKVNLAPLSNKPNPAQINLTVLNTPINATKVYYNNSFFPHQSNKFNIPISSPWFAEVYYNVSFTGNFKYISYSSNMYNASVGKDVVWNSTLNINHFPSESSVFNRTAMFYKPQYWRYNCTYNGTNLFNNLKTRSKTNYIELLNISNNEWTVNYKQTSTILSKTIRSSSDQNNWYPLQNFVNITDYINVTAQLNCSNGISTLRVKTTTNYLTIQSQITKTALNFPLWRPDLNTTAITNNTKIELQIMVSNGTIAGIELYSFSAILSQLNATLTDSISVVLKNDLAYYNFSTKNAYNGELVNVDRLIVKTKKVSGGWQTLIKDYHYIVIYPIMGQSNISIITNTSSFLAGDYLINFTFGKQHYFDSIYNATLKINERTHNMTILGANREDRTYLYGDYAIYSIYLNDSDTGAGIVNSEFSIWANFSEGKDDLATNTYIVEDFNDGNYNISIDTHLIYNEHSAANFTLEFRSQQTGIYLMANATDILKVFTGARRTGLEILANSSTSVIYGIDPWLTLRFYDVNKDEALTYAQFTIKNDTKQIATNKYTIINNPENYTIVFSFNNLEIGNYNLTITAFKLPVGNLTYIASQINFNFTCNLANFTAKLDSLPVLYADDVSKSILLNLTYPYGPITDALIISYLGNNSLSVATTQPGIFKLFLDSTNLTMNTQYYFNLTISRAKFRSYIYSKNLTISPYPSGITVPENYQHIQIYQQQTLTLIAIVKDTFRQRDILNAEVKMKIDGHISESLPFGAVAMNFSWFEGYLDIGDLVPGVYLVFVEITAPNYIASNTTVTITVLEKVKTSLELFSELASFYVSGTDLKIEAKLTGNNEPIKGANLKFEILEVSTTGGTKTQELSAATNKEGIASVIYTIPEDLSSFELKVIFEGSEAYKTTDLEETTIEVRSPTQQLWIDFTFYLPYIIGGIALVTGYKVRSNLKMKKLRVKWSKQELIFNDIMNIQFLLVLHKTSGVSLIQSDIGETKLDGTLIGGFLQAITSFVYGLKSQKITGKEESKFLFDHQDNKIYLEDGENIRVALILKDNPSDHLKQELTLFIKRFEAKYGEYLKEFNGILKYFNDYLTLSTKEFRLYLTRPHSISQKRPSVEISKFQDQLYSFAISYRLITKSEFSMAELRKYLISMLKDHNASEITANLFELIDKQFLNPILQ